MHKKRYDLPPLDVLRGFEAAARNLSFTKAAEELLVTQSAVSRQIKSLEEHLGLALFERRTRALALTDGGAALHRSVTALLDGLQAAVDAIRPQHGPPQLAVTTTSGFASLWLIPRLARFTAAHPEVDVRISATTGVLDLERDRVDVAIRYCRPQSAPAGAQRLFGDAVLPVCAPALLASPARPLVRPADLVHHTLLRHDTPGRAGATIDWDTWLTALGLGQLKPAGSLHFNQYEQMIQAAVAGQGVALGQRRLVAGLIEDGALVTPFEETLAGERAYFVIASEAAARRPHVLAFVDWLRAEARSE